MYAKKLIIMSCGLLVSMVLFMTVNSSGNWDFVLPFRGGKLLALLLVAYAISISTVLFQTLTANRILTPYIMGFDSLYLLIQSALVLLLGGLGYAMLDPSFKFSIEIGIMLIASLLIFSSLLFSNTGDLYRMILVGVILGVLFRSLASFIQRIIDPDDFAVVQNASFAQFNVVNTSLLQISLVLIVGVSFVIWRLRHILDVMALGREHAINLGISYRRCNMLVLFLIAILVSVSTALVGPVSFFGLLVSGITYVLMKTHRHAILIPAAFLVGALCLVSGQMLFEHVLGMKAVLSVVVEFLGGIVFLVFLLKRKAL
ncbi:MAG: iron chelate uptake ABC transporter family permease subunit [Alcaligenaceae bacterium]|nr:iron chelate uptake ABC transporter family permease subunit [Alcaligenaceae bacterium]